ncbi:glycoside hydrolase family 3 N-terminal domain-containing protein [Tessaracoccus antarcticus]|uniref:beta-glucosidase n=1 Tax=Tessaracoccus antarcticus TaxID=2479848 RepID=A0A3M0GRW7_9ACTN|nr:glycoside hydrolase family 3 N-terminal domain-containing protein [Tessaracoccus antarcticus]RMB60036.1 glycoside hydrolase family 3 [Tessaracoccus antarcticus]
MRQNPKRFLAVGLAGSLSVGLMALLPATPALAAETDLAQLGVVSASATQSDQDGTFPASNVNDGNPETRWASGNGPDDGAAVFTADLTVDLGSVATITSVAMAWEASYAEAYDIQVASASPDQPASWETVHTTTAGDGGADAVTLESVDARYVRLDMKKRAAALWDAPTLHYYGYSLYTLAVNGDFATPMVSLGPDEVVAAGDAVSIPVRLSGASDTEQSVRVNTEGGTAVAGSDYTAYDQTLIFAAGEVEKVVDIDTVSQGFLAPQRDFTVRVSDPTAGVQLGIRTTASITIRPTGDGSGTGPSEVLHDFQSGVPTDFTVWGSNPSVTPVLGSTADDTVPGSAADNQVLVATVGGSPSGGDWFGFTHDTPATDWSGYDGFQFWFEGSGSGKMLSFEVKSDGQLFDHSIVDDAAGWRRVSVLFSDLRVKGNPGSDERFNSRASTGFAVTLTGLGAGSFRMDDFALFQRLVVLDDFENDITVGSGADPIGYFTWSNAENAVTLGREVQERDGNADNHVLAGTHLIPSGSYGGMSYNLANPQDWSSFHGIRFLWYASQTNNPASPTAGADIKVEIKDGGTDAEHSELWQATFKDRWGSSTSRWKLVELPFSSFTPGGYQPGSSETQNGTLDLDNAWGYAITFDPGTAEAMRWAIDDAGLYGTPTVASSVTVAAPGVTLVDGGSTASVPLTLTTTDGEPTGEPVDVTWNTSPGTALEGTDYTAASGSMTFPAGTPSGTAQPVEVQTLARTGASEALTIPLEITADGAVTADGVPRVVINAHDLAYLDSSLPTKDRVADLLGRMSLQEKAGQMAQAERLGLSSVEQISDLALGSLLSGGGSVPNPNTPEAWAAMIDGYQRQALSTRWQIPMVYGADAVHGHSNVLGATIFPHNIGLGATRDLQLIRNIGRATASETRTTGVTWTFAPALTVGRDERWGRTYESFSEDPKLVAAFAVPATEGLQGDDPTDITAADEVLGSAKHWAGDGGTTYDASQLGKGYPIDQGVTHVSSMAEFMRLHADPYIPAVDAGIGTIMPSYSGVSVNNGPVLRMSEHAELNNGVLKGDMGFTGFLISDWEAIDKLPGGTYQEKVVRSVNAGMDMVMAPYNFATFIDAVVAGVESDAIAQARVDDAVTRILTEKMHLGLFEQPFTVDSQRDMFGGSEHRMIAREAAAQSQVLLRNDGALPLAHTGRLYVAGSNADDLGNQMGGWSISWQGGSGDTTTGTSILEGLREVAPDLEITHSRTASEPTQDYDAGLVIVGETPYAEGQGDVGNNGKSLSLSATDQKAIETVCGAMECTVVVVSGRPQVLTGAAAGANAVVASFLPGSEGAGVADVLMGERPFTGQLSLTWPKAADQVPINVGDDVYEPAYAYGWGLRTDQPKERLSELVAGLQGDARMKAQSLVDAGVWAADGSISDPAAAWPLLKSLADTLSGTGEDTLMQAAAVVSLARDVAQDAVVAATADADAQRSIADAEHLVWSGDPAGAVELLGQAANVDETLPPASPSPSPSASVSPSPSPSASPSPSPSVSSGPVLRAPYEVPGFHQINGRWWFTQCEPYSQTTRCRTEIWSSTVRYVAGAYVVDTGWHFNNLTYLPYMTRQKWGSNPLANTGEWTSGGRRWRTECDTAATGRGGCRSYIWMSVVVPDGGGGHRMKDQFVVNNIVRFRKG